ncbi:hypothetical protein VUN82_10150 [Micrococcaceae bacterium Sec5.1]
MGKSDALFAHRIALAVAPLSVDKLGRPMPYDGVRQGVPILVTARGSMSKGPDTVGTRSKHWCLATTWALTPARSSDAQITEVSKWRSREEELSLPIARVETPRLAKHVLALGEQLTADENQLADLVKVSEVSPLLDVRGFRANSAAKCLAAWSPSSG